MKMIMEAMVVMISWHYKTTKMKKKKKQIRTCRQIEKANNKGTKKISKLKIIDPIYLTRSSLRFPNAHWCYSDKSDSIFSMLRKTTTTIPKTTSHLLSHTIMEDTIRHEITQMTSINKAYIPCLLVTIIKWCQIIIMRQASIPWWWSLKATQKTHDIEDRAKWKRK